MFEKRKLETALATFTLGALVVYVPAETWVSWPHGLLHPLYLVDVVGMLLLLFGGVHSLRARPTPGAGPLAAAWAWSAANGWRATSWRYLEMRDGGVLEHGRAELLATGAATLVALVCLVLALYLSRASTPGEI